MSSPPIKEIVRGIRFDLDNAPAVLQDFDDNRLPDICVADGYKGSREDYAKMLISIGTGYLVEALSNHVIELQLKYRIQFDILRLQRRILTYDCLAAISYYWLSDYTVELPGVYKWQKRMVFRLIAFFHNLRVTSPQDFNDAFDAVFGLLIDQLAGRDDYKDFGIGVDADQIWLSELEYRKRKRPETVRNEQEQSQEPAEFCPKKVKPDSNTASASRTTEDDEDARAFLEEQELIEQRLVKNLTLETVRKPPMNVRKQRREWDSANSLTVTLALARAQASPALMESEFADKTW
ncbi:uncharacterized protein SCHCODRAFT_02512268 [Schizophyllum commune H4-8]|uniref:Uncharacterized protein n=1 Tax=Schizophyllum commune (strain H4-8 / FGSC 9210) TaxID=578458 RepID=D8QER0_SCHCM|nr:uncharacterized protein SCHCODRAFT_02512268 [Schizophyllum commune H4-8]KAI5888176.1 hypothetical protein SCHCODRAFT_02512268 [Schizophyllum commune H4-8]